MIRAMLKGLAMFLVLVWVVVGMTLGLMRLFPSRYEVSTRTWTNVGSFVDIRAEGFGHWAVVTDKGVYMVEGAVSGAKGADVALSSDGWLYVAGGNRSVGVYGR